LTEINKLLEGNKKNYVTLTGGTLKLVSLRKKILRKRVVSLINKPAGATNTNSPSMYRASFFDKMEILVKRGDNASEMLEMDEWGVCGVGVR
jgi:hypothetical protein